jgi:hypothetical protein
MPVARRSGPQRARSVVMASRRSTPCRIGVAPARGEINVRPVIMCGSRGVTAGPSTPTEWQPLKVLARHRGRLVTGKQCRTTCGPGLRDRDLLPGRLHRPFRRKLEPDPSNAATTSLNRAWVTRSTSTEDQLPRGNHCRCSRAPDAAPLGEHRHAFRRAVLQRRQPRAVLHTVHAADEAISSDDWFDDVERARVARRVDRC